ncbi:MAG: hypothetical protein HFH49_04375 [Lachnospiraceae bacterium]|nr:hypothetical protein [Lachnospiraceae bacterium]
MTIQDIRFSMHSFDQAVYVGKALEAAGERLLLAGVFRKENSVTLCLFAEDEDVTQLQKERVKMEKKRQRGTLTLRDEKMLNLKEDGNNLMEFIRGIRVNGKEYEFRSGSGGRMEEYNLEGRCLVYHLLEHGVSFGFLEERPLSMVQCMAMELEGEYDRIPFSEQDLEDLAFLTAPRHYHVPVNQKIKVKIGAQNGKMRKFTDTHGERQTAQDGKMRKLTDAHGERQAAENGKMLKFTDAQERRAAEDAKGEHCGKQRREIPYYINEIELADTFSEFKERYDKMLAEQDSEETGFSREDYEMFMEHLREICPPGMRNLQIAYECEEASLEFCTKQQLQEKVKSRNGATAFFLAGKSGKKKGMHGIDMKICLIQYPVEADISEIELELLSAYVQE